jgi:hypothetical protein
VTGPGFRDGSSGEGGQSESFRRRRRLLVLVVPLVVAFIGSFLGSGASVAAARLTTLVAPPAQHAGSTPLRRRVRLADIPPQVPIPGPHLRPFLTPSAAGRAPHANLAGPAAPLLPSKITGQQGAAPQPKIMTGSTLVALRAFSATSSVQGVEPPDTQVAVGPGFVGEALNDTLSVWTRGGSLAASADLNVFFSIPTGAGYFFSDPRIVHDAASGRWFLSGMGVNPTVSNSNIYLAVSVSADPTGGWFIYELASVTGVIGDQPKIGVSDDKLVISWNDFNSSGTYLGEQTWVLQKSDLLIGSTVRETQFALDSTRNSIVPATSLSATSTEYLAYNNTCSNSAGVGTGSCTATTPTLGVVAITGTPAAGNVAWTEADPAAIQTSNPPPAAQPTGPTINTNDDRLLSAVWQNGELWTTANDACVAGGAVQSCLRLFEVSTNTPAAPAVIVDADIGQAGDDFYYPAITLDGSGDPYVVGPSPRQRSLRVCSS